MDATELKARHVMNRQVTTVTPRAIGRDMVLQLLSGMHSGLPAVDSSGVVIGVVAEFDLLQAVHESKDLLTVKAEEIMSRTLVSAQEALSTYCVLNGISGMKVYRPSGSAPLMQPASPANVAPACRAQGHRDRPPTTERGAPCGAGSQPQPGATSHPAWGVGSGWQTIGRTYGTSGGGRRRTRGRHRYIGVLPHRGVQTAAARPPDGVADPLTRPPMGRG